MPFHTEVYCWNPKCIANYKKSYIGLGKNDYVDAFIIADFARVGKITTKPWRGCQSAYTPSPSSGQSPYQGKGLYAI